MKSKKVLKNKNRKLLIYLFRAIADDYEVRLSRSLKSFAKEKKKFGNFDSRFFSTAIAGGDFE
jgi:hypothetical protein